MTKYRITTPVDGYTGMSAGVNFTNGCAEVEAPPTLPELTAKQAAELSHEDIVARAETAQDPAYRAVTYFRSQGYGVEELDEQADTKPATRGTSKKEVEK